MSVEPLKIKRRMARPVQIGSVFMGSDHPVVIQSMTNTRTQDVDATLAQIRRLEDVGCEVVRLAVPDEAAVEAFGAIKGQTDMPLVADIHFDYRLALGALEAGAHKVRINPGNIGSNARVRAVYDAAGRAGAAVRIGVNAGSLEKGLLKKHGGVTAGALVESALSHIAFAESCGFENLVISIKASDVVLMIEATRQLAESCDYPLHLGVTEAGTPGTGSIRSAVGLGALLSRGIGDTIRVSLTGDPVEEIGVAWHILGALHLRHRGVTFVSCPTCGRTHGDLPAMARAIESAVSPLNTRLTLAVMGCEVNGPGEAREADLGVALGKGVALIFKKGQPVDKVAPEEVVSRMVEMVQNWENES